MDGSIVVPWHQDCVLVLMSVTTTSLGHLLRGDVLMKECGIGARDRGYILL